jgi:hypothetical protein
MALAIGKQILRRSLMPQSFELAAGGKHADIEHSSSEAIQGLLALPCGI